MPETAAISSPSSARVSTPVKSPAPAPTRVTPTTSPIVSQATPPTVQLQPGKPTSATLQSSGGEVLHPSIQGALERSFQVDLRSVRVHTDTRAQITARNLSARAVTYGTNIFLGPGESPADLSLIAHEVAHVVQQQGASTTQPWTINHSDPYEREAHQASAAALLGESFTVRERTSAPRVQRFLDVRGWLAEKAAIFPGFTMLTVVIGKNPITGADVDRSAGNILKGAIEMIPVVGTYISQALANHNIFDKVSNWVAQQFNALRNIGSSIMRSIEDFIKGFKLTDLASPGEVWERGKRLVTDPIDRIKSFAISLKDSIADVIKDAILKPIGKLAKNAAPDAYNLLCAILGNDPVTGEAVSSDGEALLSAFMTFVNQGEVLAKMKQAKALPRASAWFKTTMSELKGFVSEIPGLFIAAFKSLKLIDIVTLVGAFAKLASVFGGFAGRFISWGANAIWKLLEIVFDVVSPGAFGYVKKTGAALKSILKNPLPFVGNLVQAAKAGFLNFGANFLTHLKAGLLDWLVGSLPGVYIPKALSLVEFGKLALSVFGITWAQIRAKIVKALGPNGETIMKGLELAFDVIKALVTGGPAAAWEVIKEKLTNLKDMIVDGIVGFIKETVVTKAIPKLIAMFIPGAGFISAIISIYDTVMVFVQKISKIIQVVTAFINSIVAIAAGNIGAAAAKVESILAGLLALAINFLAGFVGLGKAADKIREVINKVRATVDKALDTAINFIVSKAKALFKSLFAKNAKDGDPEKEKMVQAGLAAIDAADQAAMKDGALTKEAAEKVATTIKQQHPVFKSLTVVETKDRYDYDYVASPDKRKQGGPKGGTVGPLGIARKMLSFTADTKAQLLEKFKRAFPPGLLGQWKEAKLDIRHKVSISDTIKHMDAAISPLTIADAAKALENQGFKPATKDRPGIIAACRELLQKANNDLGNLFVGAAGKNRRLGKRYDPGDVRGASATAAKHDPQKEKFIGEYGFEGTEFVVTIDITEDGVKTETWSITT